MSFHRHPIWTRRDFCLGFSAAGVAALLNLHAPAGAARPLLETTTIRLPRIPALCFAPQFLAEEFLRLEGFTDVQYVDGKLYDLLASGEVDVTQSFVAPFIRQIDNQLPVVLLGGVHVGCYQLIAVGDIKRITDLRGKTLAVPPGSAGPRLFIGAILSYVGLNPDDVRYVEHPKSETARLLLEGEIDAYLGFPPVPQELRAKSIGRVLLNSSTDQPWSQYFCCVSAGNREFVREHPEATKRALRAIMKADTICAREPEKVARYLVDQKITDNYDYAIGTLRDVGYGYSARYNVEDTVRFYALRLHDVGLIKSSPNSIISRGTDFSIADELQKELKF